MMRPRQILLLAAVLALLSVLGWIVQERLVIGADLRLFMPSPRTTQERLILEEIGEGPASRMLLIAIGNGDPENVAATSKALSTKLRGSSHFRFIANGEADFGAIDDAFLPYRYLLSPTLDGARLDADFLAAALLERTRDLASPAAALLEPWVSRDPTLELLALGETWMPDGQPKLLHDVWFDPSGREALLVAETQAAGFDPDGQRHAQTALRQAFSEARADPSLQLTISGPGAFTVLMQERTQGDAQTLGTVATIGMVLLMLLAYRSVPLLVLGLLPLVAAAVVGLAAVGVIFGEVHGITLAFGFTLIGVAQDYPIHLFSHQHAGIAPSRNAQAIWPTLATGVASTCVAYLAFLFSGVLGLAQLSVFTIAGLATASLATRFVLPPLLPPLKRDPANSASLGRLWHSIASLPRPRWMGVMIAASCIALVAFSPRPLWQNDLGGLTPIPKELIVRDTELRRNLGAPDVRHLIVLEDDDAQTVLERSIQTEAALRAAVTAGSLDSFDHPARYLPPISVQERRRASLPDPSALQDALALAVARTDFRLEAFESFLADVERARHLPALRPANLAGTPLDARVGSLLSNHDGHWVGTITLTGVRDPAALAKLAATISGATFLDLKQASEDLVAHQRERILACLGFAALLLVAVVAAALRNASRVRRVLAPMALTTLMIVALLHLGGVSLSLFHLIALVLAAGLGLDYALFFEHAADDPAEQRRTLHAVLVCALSTLMVFALLAMSGLPVLRAIGVTVAIGVVSNFLLALLLTRPRAPETDAH